MLAVIIVASLGVTLGVFPTRVSSRCQTRGAEGVRICPQGPIPTSHSQSNDRINWHPNLCLPKPRKGVWFPWFRQSFARWVYRCISCAGVIDFTNCP